MAILLLVLMVGTVKLIVALPGARDAAAILASVGPSTCGQRTPSRHPTLKETGDSPCREIGRPEVKIMALFFNHTVSVGND